MGGEPVVVVIVLIQLDVQALFHDLVDVGNDLHAQHQAVDVAAFCFGVDEMHGNVDRLVGGQVQPCLIVQDLQRGIGHLGLLGVQVADVVGDGHGQVHAAFEPLHGELDVVGQRERQIGVQLISQLDLGLIGDIRAGHHDGL